LRWFIFPRGRTYSAPSDELSMKVVDLITHSGEARSRLCQQAYTAVEPGNPLGLLQEALELSERYEPLEIKLRQARKEGLIRSDYFGFQIDEAETADVISTGEAAELRAYHEKVLQLLAVDDFAPEDIGRMRSTADEPVAAGADNEPARQRAAARKQSKRKTAAKRSSGKKPG
ncbi:MAG: acyl-CoA dehydrogenase domain-containing protein, partial [Woeseiaceae bacterium]